MCKLKTLLKIAAVAAVIPYRIAVTPASEEENVPKKVSVDAFLWRVEATKAAEGEEHGSCRVIIPSEVCQKTVAKIKGAFSHVKEKCAEAKEKACTCGEAAKDKAVEIKEKVAEGVTAVKEKVTEVADEIKTKVEEVKAKRAAKTAEEVPVEDITVIPTEEPVPEDVSTQKKPARKKSSKKVEA